MVHLLDFLLLVRVNLLLLKALLRVIHSPWLCMPCCYPTDQLTLSPSTRCISGLVWWCYCCWTIDPTSPVVEATSLFGPTLWLLSNATKTDHYCISHNSMIQQNSYFMTLMLRYHVMISVILVQLLGHGCLLKNTYPRRLSHGQIRYSLYLLLLRLILIVLIVHLFMAWYPSGIM